MAELEVQPWERWRPSGGPMQVLGELEHGAYARLAAAGWAWDEHEEEWDEFPDGTKVLLLGRDGRSRFMLEAVPYAPEVGVRVWGPGGEPREELVAELLTGLDLVDQPLTLDATWPDDPSEEDRVTDRLHLAEAEKAPFALYGLGAAYRGTRALNGLGRSGDVVNHVTLSHGLWTSTTIDVSVTVRRSVDPLPMIAVELLNRTGARFAGGAELLAAARDVLQKGFEDGEIRVDGEAWPFRFMREGAHWAALHDLAADHLLYVVASNVEPSEVELTRLDDLSDYA